MGDYGTVPIVLGTTGHRRLPDDVAELRGVLRTLLAKFRTDYPSTPMVMLSALAEGADRIVAQEALDLGFDLIAPLPLAVEEYEKDFQTPESLAEFRALLARASKVVVVAPPPSSSADAPLGRDAAYANCGAYIVRSCMELIAVWDGRNNPERGGTADVVNFQLNGIPAPYLPEYRALDPALTGPVLHVTTSRRGEDALAAQPTVVTIFPQPAVIDYGKAYERAKSDIERFNFDTVAGPLADTLRGKPVREQADRLASFYQRRTYNALISIVALVFFAVVGFNVYTTLPQHPLFLLIVYLACAGGAFVPYWISKRGDWQTRYQDYRSLEELLRTAYYWRMAGIERSVAERLIAFDRTRVDWLPMALRALTDQPTTSLPPPQQPLTTPRLEQVFEEWVLDQKHYFADVAGKRDHRRRIVSTRAAAVLVGASVAITIGTQIATSFGWLTIPIAFSRLDTVLLFTATMFAVAAAVINNYADKRGWSEHSRHYDMMAALFGYAVARLTPMLSRAELDAATALDARAVLANLGDEAIRENTAWLNLHRSRPLNVPRI